ncbi:MULTISPECIES: thiolase family protein [Hydrogenophaga]|uniref:Thiolase n=1 Tax=Hydrogenophaga intermedia TaxID=65786 RepID=A0A1L1PV54_HYDIT|nr:MULTISPECIES: thiolase family protein [Hydrogenophaga]AOS81619.1 thiolase [Hydrogenophaga sp. PBC]TMU71116.1 thiolase family protein [Hydrogenophaga intermedia]CDN89195.1 Thiolase [Hydrogenophaga intermedia]
MEKTYVVGVGMTPFGKLLQLSIKDLTRLAVEQALDDADLRREHLQAAFFANASQGHMEGQHMVRGQVALRAMGVSGIPVVNVENACASSSTALNLAIAFVRSGQGDVALAVGAEKMFSEDKARMFSVFDSGWDVTATAATTQRLLQLGEGLPVPEGSTSSRPYSVFMDIYASFARQHMKRHGTTQRQLAAVASKNHRHSAANPLAQYQTAYSVDEVLTSPPITYPLTLLMCSPVSDGAAAAIVCGEGALKRLGLDRRRAVQVLASVVQTGSERDPEDDAAHCTAQAARRAYEVAGIGPKDVSLAEVHDATAMGEVIQIENLGLCGFGEGGECSERGDTALGGRIPVNPSGGLESRGHPIGATGLAQVHELVTQLRGEAGQRQVQSARIGIAENGGGLVGIEEAVACVTVLAR